MSSLIRQLTELQEQLEKTKKDHFKAQVKFNEDISRISDSISKLIKQTLKDEFEESEVKTSSHSSRKGLMSSFKNLASFRFASPNRKRSSSKKNPSRKASSSSPEVSPVIRYSSATDLVHPNGLTDEKQKLTRTLSENQNLSSYESHYAVENQGDQVFFAGQAEEVSVEKEFDQSTLTEGVSIKPNKLEVSLQNVVKDAMAIEKSAIKNQVNDTQGQPSSESTENRNLEAASLELKKQMELEKRNEELRKNKVLLMKHSSEVDQQVEKDHTHDTEQDFSSVVDQPLNTSNTENQSDSFSPESHEQVSSTAVEDQAELCEETLPNPPAVVKVASEEVDATLSEEVVKPLNTIQPSSTRAEEGSSPSSPRLYVETANKFTAEDKVSGEREQVFSKKKQEVLKLIQERKKSRITEAAEKFENRDSHLSKTHARTQSLKSVVSLFEKKPEENRKSLHDIRSPKKLDSKLIKAFQSAENGVKVTVLSKDRPSQNLSQTVSSFRVMFEPEKSGN